MYRNAYYSSKEGVCYLQTWDKHGNRVTITEPFKPYFYIETNLDSYDAISIYNTRLKKKAFRNAYERNKAAQDGAIKRLYYNIAADQQYLIDKFKTTYSTPEFTANPLKICFLDIEVNSPDEFPHADEAKHPINLITIYDTLDKKFYSWGLKEYTGKNKNIKYVACASEEELLGKFLDFWENDYYPDILTGWNTDLFDFPYIINRIISLLGKENAERLSPYRSMYCREGVFVKGQEMKKWYVHGITMMDYLEVYTLFSRDKLESYALNFVAEHELGEGKLAINATTLSSLADKDWNNFVDYNIQDVDLLVRMEAKLQFFRIIRMLSYKGLCNFSSALGKVTIVTGCVAIEADKQGMIVPTFVGGPLREQIDGGFVREPIPGLKSAIVTYDANSLYPNTIITLNISPETKVGKIKSEDDANYTLLLTNSKTFTISKEKFKLFVEKEKIAISKAGVLYTQKKRGVIPSLIDGLYNERVDMKKQAGVLKKKMSTIDEKSAEYASTKMLMERADTIQHVIKILLNSIYGVFANKHSPICDSDHAGSITLTGQAVIKQANEIVNRFAREQAKIENVTDLSFYNDTDSSHVTVQPILDKLGIVLLENNKISKKALELCEVLGTYLNEGIAEWSRTELHSTDPRYVFKRESICDKGVYIAKKRYIIHVMNDEGVDINKFKYVGVEIARSSTPKKAKELIKSVIEFSILNQDLAVANSKYYEVFEKFKNMTLDEVAIRVGLSDLEKGEEKSDGFAIGKGVPIHVKGALHYNELLKHFNIEKKYEKIGSGGKVKRVFLEKNRFNIDTISYSVVFPTEFNELKVDYQKMFDKIIKPPVKAVYDAIGWYIPEVNDIPTTDVFAFFS